MVRPTYLEMGFSSPLTQDEWVQHSLKSIVCGIKRIKGAPVNRKLPITVQILKQMYSFLNHYSSLGMTLWAACFGYCFAIHDLGRYNLVVVIPKVVYLVVSICSGRFWPGSSSLLTIDTLYMELKTSFIDLDQRLSKVGMKGMNIKWGLSDMGLEQQTHVIVDKSCLLQQPPAGCSSPYKGVTPPLVSDWLFYC